MKSLWTQFKIILNNYGLAYFNRYYSYYLASVEDNEDPEQAHRIKARCPAIWGAVVPDRWIQCINHYSHELAGTVDVPEIGQKIFLVFEEGDPSYPLYILANFSTGQLPERAKTNYPNTHGRYFADGTFSEYDKTEQRKSSAITDYHSADFTPDGSTIVLHGHTLEVNEEGYTLSFEDATLTVGKDSFEYKNDSGSILLTGGGFTLTDKAGTKLGDAWKDTLTALQKLTVPTPLGPSGVPINAPDFVAVMQKLSQFFK